MIARLALLALLGLLWPAACWGETLSNAQYRLRIHPDAKITERVDTGWETLMTVELNGERARIRWKPEEFTVIFANGTLRTRLFQRGGAGAYELVTDFEGKRYKVNRSPREVSWTLPEGEVFFRTFGGKIASAVGTSGFLNITRDSRAGRISLESQAGTSHVLLTDGSLEVGEGPELLEHQYFVKGLAFHRGPITLEIPLPQEPFLDALPDDRYLLVEGQQARPTGGEETPPESGETPAETPEEEDPLEAAPASWDSPLRANQGEPKEDPLNARREARYPGNGDPLKATTAKDSEEILRVKDY